MSTFNARLALTRKNLKLWITIQGIDRIFKVRTGVDCSTILGGGTRPESPGSLADPDEGGEEVDFEQMAVVGGGFSFKLVQPFGQTFLTTMLQQRARRIGWITADLAIASTTITMNDTSSLTAGDYIYIGEETITVGTVFSATSLTGCTREKFGSRARPQKSTSSVLGASVYAVPPSLTGRRVSLYASLLKDDGSSNANLTKLLNTYAIEENPKWEDDRTVSFRCGPVLDELLDMPLYVGVKETKAGRLYGDGVHDDLVTVEVEDADVLTLPTSNFPTYALIKREGLGSIARYYYADTASDPNSIEVYPDDQMDPPGLDGEQHSGPVANWSTYVAADSVRQVALVSGMTGTWALWLLCSRYGDGFNGAYDVLPGKERSNVNDPEYRFGAGMDENDIDQDAFTGITGRWVTFPLMKSCKSKDVVREVCLAAECIAYSTAAGLLSLMRMGDSTSASVLTLDASYCLDNEPAKSWVDEGGIYPSVHWKLNYDPNKDRFCLDHTTIDSEMMQRYPRLEKALEIESIGIGVDTSGLDGGTQQLRRAFPMTLEELDQAARSIQKRGDRGRLIVQRKLKLAAAVARIGDVVTLGFDANDHQGGSVNGSKGRIIGRRPAHSDGWCELTIEIFGPSYRLAPSGVVTARTTVSIANDTLTLSVAAPDSDTPSPENNFHAGQTVRIWDVSAGTSTTRTITAVLSAPPRLQFTAAAPAIEANRDWLTWDTLGTSSGTTANGDDESDWLYFMPASGVAAEGETRRYQ